jgi:hypothetical protein
MAISEPGDPPAVFRGEPGSAPGKVESIVDARRLLTINTGSSSLKAAARATAYSRKHFEDPPEISNWTWTP